MTSERRILIPTPTHGWDHPWPNVFEVARVFATTNWTLVGGAMVQAHALAHSVTLTRPTEDIDMLLHVEVVVGVPQQAANALESVLNYRLQEPLDRDGPAYRFTRGADRIDVMSPDHARPAPLLHRHPMFAIEGGKQALDRTMTLAVQAAPDETIELSVPDELGALVLKGAAYISDTRDRDRHLFDAAALAACITDHATERNRLKGSDGKRLRTLATGLGERRHPAWLSLPEPARVAGQDTLRILTAQRDANTR
jgi:hypothetical protein